MIGGRAKTKSQAKALAVAQGAFLLKKLLSNVICSLLLATVAYADDAVFERDGFRIRLAGNGGNCFGCEWLEISGQIPPDAAQLLQQFLVSENLERIPFDVALDSPGGSLLGGLQLGRLIRKLGFKTSVAKTIRDGRSHDRSKGGICFSACAYAFLGGTERVVAAGQYGIHQFYTDALLKDPQGKVFTAIDFSDQQALTGFLLSYVLEMGVKPELVVEANRTAPTDISLPDDRQLLDFRVAFEAKRYGEWKLQAYRNGLLAYSVTQDEKNQMTLLCVRGRSELLITYNDPPGGKQKFRESVSAIRHFALLGRAVDRSAVRLTDDSTKSFLHVGLDKSNLGDLQIDVDTDGSVSIGLDEPRANYGLVQEQISTLGLAVAVRLVGRNCVN